MKTTANTAMKAPVCRVLVTALRMSLLLCLLGLTFESSAQSRKRKVEKDGFVWYEFEKDGKYGAAHYPVTKYGFNAFIPIEFDEIEYHTDFGGYFTAEREEHFFYLTYDYTACYDKDGTCIIPKERGYSYIWKDEEDGIIFYHVSKEDDYHQELGICDANGREIIEPKYTDLRYDGFNHSFYYISNGEKISLNISADGSPVTPSSNNMSSNKSTLQSESHDAEWYAIKGDEYFNQKDYNQAKDYYLRASEVAKNFSYIAACYYRISECCYNEGDHTQAVIWCRKAAKENNKYAQKTLSYFYSVGDGIAENKLLAKHWLRKAAENGHADAQFELGNYYRDYGGVIEGESLAKEWYRKAAEQGHEGAKLALEEMEEKEKKVEAPTFGLG